MLINLNLKNRKINDLLLLGVIFFNLSLNSMNIGLSQVIPHVQSKFLHVCNTHINQAVECLAHEKIHRIFFIVQNLLQVKIDNFPQSIQN